MQYTFIMCKYRCHFTVKIGSIWTATLINTPVYTTLSKDALLHVTISRRSSSLNMDYNKYCDNVVTRYYCAAALQKG